MNILKYTKDQMQHRKKNSREKTGSGKKSYYEQKAKTDLHYVHVLLKMDLRRKLPAQLKRARIKSIKREKATS